MKIILIIDDDDKVNIELHKEFYKLGSSLPEQKCLHSSCPECRGTGQKQDGTFCIHNISCPCPSCSPYC